MRIYTRLPKATPGTASIGDTTDRVRRDKIDKAGSGTRRVAGQLRHIGVGRAHKCDPVRLLIGEGRVRVVGENGALLRELTFDPSCDYQRLD